MMSVAGLANDLIVWWAGSKKTLEDEKHSRDRNHDQSNDV